MEMGKLTGFCVHQGIIGLSVVKVVKSVNDRILFIILRGQYVVIFLNMHVPTEGKSDEIEDGFYEELQHVFDPFFKYHMIILLGGFSAMVGREDILKSTIANESFHENTSSNDSGVRVINFRHIQNSNCQEFNIPTSQHS
jgi:hypothetical protein